MYFAVWYAALLEVCIPSSAVYAVSFSCRGMSRTMRKNLIDDDNRWQCVSVCLCVCVGGVCNVGPDDANVGVIGIL